MIRPISFALALLAGLLSASSSRAQDPSPASNDPKTNHALGKYAGPLSDPLERFYRAGILYRLVMSCPGIRMDVSVFARFRNSIDFRDTSEERRMRAWSNVFSTFNDYGTNDLMHLCAGVDHMFGPNGVLIPKAVKRLPDAANALTGPTRLRLDSDALRASLEPGASNGLASGSTVRVDFSAPVPDRKLPDRQDAVVKRLTAPLVSLPETYFRNGIAAALMRDCAHVRLKDDRMAAFRATIDLSRWPSTDVNDAFKRALVPFSRFTNADMAAFCGSAEILFGPEGRIAPGLFEITGPDTRPDSAFSAPKLDAAALRAFLDDHADISAEEKQLPAPLVGSKDPITTYVLRRFTVPTINPLEQRYRIGILVTLIRGCGGAVFDSKKLKKLRKVFAPDLFTETERTIAFSRAMEAFNQVDSREQGMLCRASGQLFGKNGFVMAGLLVRPPTAIPAFDPQSPYVYLDPDKLRKLIETRL